MSGASLAEGLVVEGRHVAILDRGPADAVDGAAPIVLVHASGMGALQFGPVAPRLADRWRVLAPDLLGCGGSDPWPDPDHYTLAADLTVVRAVCERARGDGGPVHLVGHSYGGLLALHLAASSPALVRSLAVYEPVAFGVLPGRDHEGVADLAAHIDAAFLDARTGGDEVWVGRFINFWNGPGAWERMPPARRAALTATGRKSFLEVRALLTEAHTLDPTTIRAPTLVMSGTRSPRSARGVCRVLADLVPGARLDIFDGAGHMAPIEEPKRFVRALTEHFSFAEALP